VAEDEEKKAGSASVRRLFGLYRPELKLTILAAVVAAASSFAQLLSPYIIRNTINYFADWYSAGGDGPLVMWPFALLVLWATVLRSVLRLAHGLSRASLTVRIANGVRERMYHAIQRHSLSYHKQTTTGDLIARATRDIQSVARFIGFGVFGTADLVIFLGGAAAILFFINPIFALVALSPVPIAAFLMVWFSSGMRTRWREASEAYAEVTTVLQENIAGARVVRAFAQESSEQAKFHARADDYVGKIIGVIRYWVVRMISPDFVFGLVVPIGLVYGAHKVIGGRLRLGDLMLCFFFMRSMQHRLRHLIRIVEVCQTAGAGAERVFEILDEEPSIQTRPGAQLVPPTPGDVGALVEFRDVTFGYDPEKPVLRGISFAANPGQTIGIVGRTGSGKSTLISLIPRFHDVTGGAVLINGVDVRDIELSDLRHAVGMIFQETFLFSATIRDNITYGQPDASAEATGAVAQATQAHDFIMELEDGYDTIIGERGVTLSGGQAQRLAIARAVLLDPKVLIMDDATASVDSETERQIRETIRTVARGRTNLVVAHRISSVAHADLILVLEDGRIVESGTHRDLFALGGVYRRMCEQQIEGHRR